MDPREWEQERKNKMRREGEKKAHTFLYWALAAANERDAALHQRSNVEVVGDWAVLVI